MRSVLDSNDQRSYLCPTAAGLLVGAREAARDAQLRQRSLVPVSDQRTLWFTWAGTRVQTTLRAMLALHDVLSSDREVAIQIEAPIDAAQAVIRKIAEQPPAPMQVAAGVQPQCRGKYDHLLSDELLLEAIAESVIDLQGAIAKCQAT